MRLKKPKVSFPCSWIKEHGERFQRFLKRMNRVFVSSVFFVFQLTILARVKYNSDVDLHQQILKLGTWNLKPE